MGSAKGGKEVRKDAQESPARARCPSPSPPSPHQTHTHPKIGPFILLLLNPSFFSSAFCRTRRHLSPSCLTAQERGTGGGGRGGRMWIGGGGGTGWGVCVFVDGKEVLLLLLQGEEAPTPAYDERLLFVTAGKTGARGTTSADGGMTCSTRSLARERTTSAGGECVVCKARTHQLQLRVELRRRGKRRMDTHHDEHPLRRLGRTRRADLGLPHPPAVAAVRIFLRRVLDAAGGKAHLATTRPAARA
ncbi:hypothetical protein C8R46DRAFT_685053 [Mycena filopes]|nr:hypothetical protein C8R46DRAFT_685053 [Mycena filopes]